MHTLCLPIATRTCICTGGSVIECEMCLHFLSCYTVELQLPTDACSLPGNQHSISPSTSSPQTHTCAVAHRQHACAHKHTNTHSSSLTSQRLRFWRQRKSLLTAGAAPPPHFVVIFPVPLSLPAFFSILKTRATSSS